MKQRSWQFLFTAHIGNTEIQPALRIPVKSSCGNTLTQAHVWGFYSRVAYRQAWLTSFSKGQKVVFVTCTLVPLPWITDPELDKEHQGAAGCVWAYSEHQLLCTQTTKAARYPLSEIALLCVSCHMCHNLHMASDNRIWTASRATSGTPKVLPHWDVWS